MWNICVKVGFNITSREMQTLPSNSPFKDTFIKNNKAKQDVLWLILRYVGLNIYSIILCASSTAVIFVLCTSVTSAGRLCEMDKTLF